MNPDKIGKFIRELRTEKKLSQYQLADRIPISRQAVSKWERGQTIPDSSTLIRLSEIFDVTINELLKGERLDNNSIKELEVTTLSIVDDSNRKSRKIRKILVTSTITIILLLLSFLTYYFVNSYNTIKVYTVSSDSDNFLIYDGIFITTKQKTYLKLGKIMPKQDMNINNIKVYYKKGKEKKKIFENKDADSIIIDQYGYEGYFPEEDLNYITKNSYVEILYNESEIEIIKLVYNRDFINDAFLFLKKTQDSNKKEIINNSPLIEEETIEYLLEKGVYEDEIYYLDIMNADNRIRFSYHPSMNQIIMSKNDEITWTVFVGTQVYSCPQDISTKDNPNIKQQECFNLIKDNIKKYLH